MFVEIYLLLLLYYYFTLFRRGVSERGVRRQTYTVDTYSGILVTR